MEKAEYIFGKALLQSNLVATVLTDRSLSIKFANAAFCNKLGYKENEIEGESLTILLDSPAQRKAVKASQHFLKYGTPPKEHWVVATKDGRKLNVDIEAKKVEHEGDVHFLIIAQDFTEKSEVQDELERTRNLLTDTELMTLKGSFEYRHRTEELIWTAGMYQIFEVPEDQEIPHVEEQAKLFSEKDRERLGEAIERCLETEEDVSLKVSLHLPDKIKYLEVIFRLMDKGDAWIYGSMKDITKQVRSEQELVQKEEKYRLLLESIPHIIWTSDLEGSPNYMNHKGLAYFGKSSEDLSDWLWSDYLHEEEVESLKEEWDKAKNAKKSISKVHRLKNAAGVYKSFQVITYPHLNDKGEVLSWTGVATNIHELIEAEETLKLTNKRLRALIDASPVAIYSLDINGIVLDFWNPAAEQLFGWTKEEVIGKFLPHVKEGDEEEFLELANLIKEEGEMNKQVVRTNKKGEKVIVDVTAGAVYDDDDGEVSEMLITVIDMTELDKNRKKIQASLHEKETLLQEIHHRVKNNLAIVVGLLQLQVFRSVNEVEKIRLTEAQNRVHSIAMVHELLYQSDDFTKVNLHTYYDKLLKGIKENMQIGGQSIDHKLKIDSESLNINQAIPLGLLINELATNSAKYAFEDVEQEINRITLSIHREAEKIHVVYQDNGKGYDRGNLQNQNGLGMQIIESLLAQLDADYEFNTDNQFRLELEFVEQLKGSHSLGTSK
ncbi:MAG: hypothetical protein CL670_05125 [Balneola sp.]|nr:hypothetical protein [Balneola sp.]MBE78514.1 hypothetical protein [Balneola sp.]